MNDLIDELKRVDIPINQLVTTSTTREDYLFNSKVEVLQRSLQEEGQTEPLLVKADGMFYTIIDGNKRLLALKALGKTVAKCMPINWSELLYRIARGLEIPTAEIYNPIQYGHIIKAVQDTFKIDQRQLAFMCNLSPHQVRRLLGYITLPPLLQEYVVRGDFTISHAKELRKIGNNTELLLACGVVVVQELSVRDTADFVRAAIVPGSNVDAAIRNNFSDAFAEKMNRAKDHIEKQENAERSSD